MTFLAFFLLPTVAASGAAATIPSRLDSASQAFVTSAEKCVTRANGIWRTTPQQIRANPSLFELNLRATTAVCSLQFGLLAKQDRHGDWSAFEQPAHEGIAAVQGWAEAMLAFLQATRDHTRYKALLDKALTDTKQATIFWHEAIVGINSVRARAGLRPFPVSPG